MQIPRKRGRPPRVIPLKIHRSLFGEAIQIVGCLYRASSSKTEAQKSKEGDGDVVVGKGVVGLESEPSREEEIRPIDGSEIEKILLRKKHSSVDIVRPVQQRPSRLGQNIVQRRRALISYLNRN